MKNDFLIYRLYRIAILGFLTLCVTFEFSCGIRAYPDDKLNIDSSFLKLFNSLIKESTFSFKNSKGDKKKFIIIKIDSVISNKKGGIMDQAPYKLIRMTFREIGNDTTRLERNNEIFINKNPATNTNSLCIKMNNFYYFQDDKLPSLNHDTLVINAKKITNYYFFKTSLQSKQPNDIEELYVGYKEGFIGFKTSSGGFWLKEN